jgi:uncharacterized protein YuzE
VRISYDERADAAYVYLIRSDSESEVRRTVACDPTHEMINLDFDLDGRLIGIEVLDARKKLPAELLNVSISDGPNTHALYLRALGTLLKQDALDALKRREAEHTEFESGRVLAYYEVLSTMRGQAVAFDLPLDDLQLHDFDPDRELV